MRRLTSVAGTVVLLVASAWLLSGCGGSATATGTASGGMVGTRADEPGETIFLVAGCGACHTLRDARTTGLVGPNLDRIDPSENHVRRFVLNGGVGMPSFSGLLKPKDIATVSEYVARVSGY